MNTSEFEETAASVPHGSPESEYARRLRARQRQIESIRNLHRRLWVYISAAALGCMIVSWVAFSSHLISKLWILLPSVVALSMLRALGRNAELHGRVERIIRFYEVGLARLSHQWQGRGVTGDELRPADHAYASDLDLFGTGSLFELLCTARTGIGRATLANWLLYPAQSEEVAKRQAAIGELREALISRRVGVCKRRGYGASRDIGPRWTNAPAIVFPFYLRALAITLPICLVIFSLFAGAGAVGHNTKWAVAVAAALEGLLAIPFGKKRS